MTFSSSIQFSPGSGPKTTEKSRSERIPFRKRRKAISSSPPRSSSWAVGATHIFHLKKGISCSSVVQLGCDYCLELHTSVEEEVRDWIRYLKNPTPLPVSLFPTVRAALEVTHHGASDASGMGGWWMDSTSPDPIVIWRYQYPRSVKAAKTITKGEGNDPLPACRISASSLSIQSLISR